MARGLVGVAAVLVVAALVVARRRGGGGQRSLAGALVLVAAHPGIWMEPELLDCGRSLVHYSMLFTGLVATAAAWTALRPPSGEHSG